MTATLYADVPPAIDKIDVGDVIQMVTAEYLEMPGLRLTLPQAQRLWNLNRETCTTVFGRLVEGRFLCRTETGSYQRSDLR